MYGKVQCTVLNFVVQKLYILCRERDIQVGFCHRCCSGLLIMNPGCCCCARKEIISWKMPVDTDLYDCCHVCKEGAIWEGYVMVFFPMQVQDLQQRKCTIMFELSCNLERILEFFTQELPQAFLQGPEMNLIRLCELIIFVLNHTTCSADALFFDRLYSYPHLSLPLTKKKRKSFGFSLLINCH